MSDGPDLGILVLGVPHADLFQILLVHRAQHCPSDLSAMANHLVDTGKVVRIISFNSSEQIHDVVARLQSSLTQPRQLGGRVSGDFCEDSKVHLEGPGAEVRDDNVGSDQREPPVGLHNHQLKVVE